MNTKARNVFKEFEDEADRHRESQVSVLPFSDISRAVIKSGSKGSPWTKCDCSGKRSQGGGEGYPLRRVLKSLKRASLIYSIDTCKEVGEIVWWGGGGGRGGVVSGTDGCCHRVGKYFADQFLNSARQTVGVSVQSGMACTTMGEQDPVTVVPL